MGPFSGQSQAGQLYIVSSMKVEKRHLLSQFSSGGKNKSLGYVAVADISAQRTVPTLEKKSEELQMQ